jgi:hypothetical protein
MPDYSKTVIYKIKHNEDYDDINIYIGSTTNFKVRKNQHKNSCNNENNKDYNYPIYQYIRDKGGWEKFVMIPITNFPCNSKNEKEIKERYYIDLLKPKLNKQLPTRTNKEWREDNKELILEKHKEWRDNNKDKISENGKIYRENNKELISEKYKEYRKNNKEKIKEYYENNKEKINEKRKEKVECQCGSIVRKSDIKRHERTQKHKNFLMLFNNKTETETE